jgi:hypothetical protein
MSELIKKFSSVATQNVRWLRAFASKSQLGNPASEILTVAKNMEIIMDRVAKIITALETENQALVDKLAAVPAAPDPSTVLSANDIKALTDIATKLKLDPTTGDPITTA